MFRKRSKTLRYRKVRYSNETNAFEFTSTIAQNSTSSFPVNNNKLGTVMVGAIDQQGCRKVKNFTLSVTTKGNSVPVLGVLVYVPFGTDCSQVFPGVAPNISSLYEPNQNVIMQFILNPVEAGSNVGSNVQRFKTRLARNLDSGDRIMIAFAPALASNNQQDITICGTLNYAISF